MPDIYQDLWDADASDDGCSVCARIDGEPGPADETADILIDVQAKAAGGRDRDVATRPLFSRVRPERLAHPVYKKLIALFDNYVPSTVEEEVETREERREIDSLLDAVVETPVATVALSYLEHHLGETLTKSTFRAALEQLWFTLYTNHFHGNAIEYASGFEHVFVGEGKYGYQRGRRVQLGEISGYHSWVKFYLDEACGRVNFLGYRYDLHGGELPVTPNVVTLKMLWELVDERGEVTARLFKKTGGFFVGSSPACELVMGAVAYFESLHGMLTQDRRRTQIHGAEIDLVLYRNITSEGKRGEHIRSFYPVLIGPDAERGATEDFAEP